MIAISIAILFYFFLLYSELPTSYRYFSALVIFSIVLVWFSISYLQAFVSRRLRVETISVLEKTDFAINSFMPTFASSRFQHAQRYLVTNSQKKRRKYQFYNHILSAIPSSIVEIILYGSSALLFIFASSSSSSNNSSTLFGLGIVGLPSLALGSISQNSSIIVASATYVKSILRWHNNKATSRSSLDLKRNRSSNLLMNAIYFSSIMMGIICLT